MNKIKALIKSGDIDYTVECIGKKANVFKLSELSKEELIKLVIMLNIRVNDLNGCIYSLNGKMYE